MEKKEVSVLDRSIKEKIPSYVHVLFDTLAAAGHRGYLVGGSLRDLLRGVAPHDYDMTTDASPDEMLEIFADFRVIPTGLKHGTLTVLSEGHPIEITTHRCDGEYLDARRPESVTFTRRLADDLARRDFTVNAMAWNEQEGLVDLFGGREDLQSGIIRAVGDPATRFSEDALRILRAFRFSAQLDFEIEPGTLAAARERREGLARISVERIFGELTRLLEAPAASRGLSALLDADCGELVFFDCLPDRGAIKAIEGLAPDAALRLSLLLLHESPLRLHALAKRWHASNAFCDALAGVVEAAREPLPATLYHARRFVVRYWPCWERALALRAAFGEQVEEAFVLSRTVVRDKTAVELRRLAVNGRELQDALGIRPECTGELLARLQDLVWQKPERNKKSVLLGLAVELCREHPTFLKYKE